MKTRKKFNVKTIVTLMMTLLMVCVLPVMSVSAADYSAHGSRQEYTSAKGDPTGVLTKSIEHASVPSGKTGSGKDGVWLAKDKGFSIGTEGHVLDSSGTEIGNKTYVTTGGGALKYAEVVNGKGTVNGNFTQLTSSSQEELLTDMATVEEAVLAGDEAGYVSEQTADNWLKSLQQCNGVGTQLMNTILKNIKPDYATANHIFKPFSGLFNTILALGAILIMAFLGITMVLDLSYIGIPAFRLAFGGGEDGDKGKKPKLISHEAVSAVLQAEDAEGGKGQGGGGNKVAVGIYFKKRVVMLVVLGICLLYLISGQIYTLVSWVLDLVSGFFGF